MTDFVKPTSFEMASLRLDAFRTLKGWGSVRENGEFKAWDGTELKRVAAEYVNWALGFHLTCGFCGKNSDEVKKLLAGVSAFICDECVKTASETVSALELETTKDNAAPTSGD